MNYENRVTWSDIEVGLNLFCFIITLVQTADKI